MKRCENDPQSVADQIDDRSPGAARLILESSQDAPSGMTRNDRGFMRANCHQ